MRNVKLKNLDKIRQLKTFTVNVIFREIDHVDSVTIDADDLFGAIGYGDKVVDALDSLSSEIEACYFDYVVADDEIEDDEHAKRWKNNLMEYFMMKEEDASLK